MSAAKRNKAAIFQVIKIGWLDCSLGPFCGLQIVVGRGILKGNLFLLEFNASPPVSFLFGPKNRPRFFGLSPGSIGVSTRAREGAVSDLGGALRVSDLLLSRSGPSAESC
jgi:hypothetical protein